MRSWWCALAVLLVALVAACSRETAGTAIPGPHRPGVAVSDDGNGIVVGLPDAPVKLAIFTEPQCPACARLQRKFGGDLGLHVLSGELTITYRPETFLDELGTRYSARVANALFLAGDSTATAAAYQAYVMALWGHQDPEGSKGPSDRQLARWARDSGIPDKTAERIVAAESGVDVEEMSTANYDHLSEVCAPEDAATPTVYDTRTDQIIDTSDDDWLDRLVRKL